MELEALREASEHVLSSPDLSRRFLKELGFDKSTKGTKRPSGKKKPEKFSGR
jgi:hypothetical protein